MAKYLGLLSTDSRGKLGGHVHTRGTSGTVFRAKVSGVQPRTAAQSAWRQQLIAAQSAWKTLDYTTQLDWIALAGQTTWTNTLGNLYQPTPQQLFVQCFLMLAGSGFGPIPTAPTAVPNVPAPTNLRWDETGFQLNVRWLLIAGSVNPSMWLSLTPPYSPGARYTSKGQAPRVIVEPFSSTTYNASPYYDAKYPAGLTGTNVRAYAQAFDPASGWPSAIVSASLFVTL